MTDLILRDEKTLEDAEQILEIWAYQLADAGRDTDAAEALRVAGVILRFRGEFLGREKRP